MAKLLKLRRGTTTQHGSFTGAEGEVTVDTDKETLVVHDGSTAGGHPVAAEDMANVSSASIAGRLATDSIAVGKIAAGTLPSDVKVADANISGNLTIESADIVDGTIVNGDVNTSAAIAGTKIAPDFGSQHIQTTGNTLLSDSSGSSNGRLIFGAGNDLQIFHDPEHSYIQNGTGDLFVKSNADDLVLQAADDVLIRPQNGEDGIKVIGDGAVELYFNSGKKFETTNGGATVTGNLAVTGTVDGRDVASDGTKLDGIESSATADQTAAEIRTLVESASDSNVFTDADHSKLNGIEASATADQTAAEIRTLVESASDSNVFTDADHSKLNGIESGATADQSGAEIASALGAQSIYTTGNIGRDANDHIAFTDNTRMDIYINNNNEFRFESDGDFHADGDVYAFSTTVSSDENLKKDITTVSDAVTKVEALKGVTFKWKKNDADSAGVIAQDVEKVLPEVVKTVNDMDGNEYKAVNYAGLTSILIEAVKDLSARIKVLEAK